jgi:hypothetical protein
MAQAASQAHSPTPHPHHVRTTGTPLALPLPHHNACALQFLSSCVRYWVWCRYLIPQVFSFFSRFHFRGPNAWTTQPYYPSTWPSVENCNPAQGPKIRSRFGRKSGTFVQEWPSTGGILIADDCSAVELEFLGLERFRETQSSGD